jgi:hypothetical protein
MPSIPISTTSTIDKSPTVGALLGAEAEYQLTDMISLAAGLNYSLQGSGWENYKESGVELKDAKIELGYVAIPVVANFYLFKGFAIKAGIQPAFLTNANEKFTIEKSSSAGNVSVNYDESIKDDCEKFDLSVPMGISYQFQVPVVIDLRYNLGVSKVFKGDSDKNPKNNVISLTVGYKFAL